MRIYSKTPLSWPLVLHITQAVRLYPGQWQNYYFYRVKLKTPTLLLQTYSPIELLQDNTPFYCYHRYNRDQYLENLGNKLALTYITHIKHIHTKKYIYIPKSLEINDILIVKNNLNTIAPSIYLPSLFNTHSIV
jgi:hypothetical protein